MKKLCGLTVLVWLLVASRPVSAAAPLGVLRARVEGLSGQSLPRELSVRVRPSLVLMGQEKLAPETTLSCPIRDGEWTCEVPAGRLDLRITGAAAMPVYRWDETVEAGRAADLGTLRLRRGATIAGWVRSNALEGKVLTHTVQVRLIPLGRPRVGLRPNPIPQVTLEQGSRPWGFFRFDSLPPGEYVVEATQAGLPAARTSSIRVMGERSAELPKPLWLGPPATVTGSVTPDRSTAGDRSWRIRLVRKPALESDEILSTTFTDRYGLWGVKGIAAGDYRLLVTDASGRAGVVRDVHLESGSQSLNIDIRTVSFSGRLTRAGQPVPAATLRFVGDESTVVPSGASTDPEGLFQIEMPAAGTGRIQVQADGILPITLPDLFPPRRRPRPGADPGSQVFPEIRIPDTRLRVTVRDSRRRPVPFAWVIVPGLEADHPKNEFKADGLGFCEIRGLSPGSQTVLAEYPDRRWKSEPRTVVLREGGAEPPLDLVLPEMVAVVGRIEPRFGTAAGAYVVVRLPGWTSVMVQADGDGEFRFPFPAGARKAEIRVLAPGAAFRKLRVDVDPLRVLQIPVEPAGGTLVLEMPDAILQQARKSKSLDSDFSLLCLWADLQGCRPEPGRLVVPNMEPDAYVLAAGAPLTLERGTPADGDPRPHGVLTAEGELTLRLP